MKPLKGATQRRCYVSFSMFCTRGVDTQHFCYLLPPIVRNERQTLLNKPTYTTFKAAPMGFYISCTVLHFHQRFKLAAPAMDLLWLRLQTAANT